jgi:hypothetical protein
VAGKSLLQDHPFRRNVMWILKYKGEIVFTSWDFSTIEPTILMMQKLGMPVTYEWIDNKQPTVDILA